MSAPSQIPEAAGLEPCPFCGAPAISGLNFEDTAYVMCSRDDKECGAMIGWRRSEAEAVNLWNRRATAASAQAAIDAEKARTYAEQQCTIEENRLRLAAEARADRLAKALEDARDQFVTIGAETADESVRLFARGCADSNQAALQQETQP